MLCAGSAGASAPCTGCCWSPRSSTTCSLAGLPLLVLFEAEGSEVFEEESGTRLEDKYSCTVDTWIFTEFSSASIFSSKGNNCVEMRLGSGIAGSFGWGFVGFWGGTAAGLKY